MAPWPKRRDGHFHTQASCFQEALGTEVLIQARAAPDPFPRHTFHGDRLGGYMRARGMGLGGVWGGRVSGAPWDLWLK